MNIHSTYIPLKNQADSFIGSTLFQVQPQQSLTPGEQAPAFSLPVSYGKWTGFIPDTTLTGRITLSDLLHKKPLLLSFYSPHWNKYGDQHIRTLANLYTGVKALGGEMLVLTPEPVGVIYHLANHYQLSFSLAQDPDNLIAYQFGIYDLQHPVWERVAGITGNVPVPATYVIAANGQITGSFVDPDFQDVLAVRPVLSAIYAARDKQIRNVA